MPNQQYKVTEGSTVSVIGSKECLKSLASQADYQHEDHEMEIGENFVFFLVFLLLLCCYLL